MISSDLFTIKDNPKGKHLKYENSLYKYLFPSSWFRIHYK